MDIKKYYLTQSYNTRRMEKINEAKYIVITSSKYKGFSALKNRNIIENIKYKEEKEFSCHYIIDIDGSIVNIVPETEMAICTKDYNIDNNSISIMLALNKQSDYEEEQIYALKKLIHKLIKKYNIDKKNVIREYDVNASRRPEFFVDEYIMLWEIVHN